MNDAMVIDLSILPLPIRLQPSTAITDAELMRFSHDNKPYRIERSSQGEITVMTPVGGIGSKHEVYVASALFQWTESRGEGEAFGSNAGFNLPDGSCLSPAAAWLALDRWNALTEDQQSGFPPLCPEFIIEIRSKSDSRRLLESKMQLWLENGAQLAWLLDPIDGDVVIYKPDQPPEHLRRPGSVLGEGAVQGFELNCRRFWPAPQP